MIYTRLAMIFFGISIFIATPAMSQVDQQNTVATGIAGNRSPSDSIGQTFRPTLNSISFAQFTLASASSGTPSSVNLQITGQGANATSDTITINGTTQSSYTFTFANPVVLVPEGNYTFNIRTLSGLVTYSYNNNGYSRGSAIAAVGSPDLSRDLIFSEGRVAAAPEPETWMLLILGFGLVGAALRVKNYRRRLVGTQQSTLKQIGSHHGL